MKQYFKYGLLQMALSIIFLYLSFVILRESFFISFGILVLFLSFLSIRNFSKFKKFNDSPTLRKEHFNFLISVLTIISVGLALFFEKGSFLFLLLLFLESFLFVLLVSVYEKENKVYFKKEFSKIISFSLIYLIFSSLIFFNLFIFIKNSLGV